MSRKRKRSNAYQRKAWRKAGHKRMRASGGKQRAFGKRPRPLTFFDDEPIHISITIDGPVILIE